MSFQVTVLKVLAGQPGGWLSLADLRRDVAILVSSGRGWTDRTKRIAEQAPDLNIFGQALVIRERRGWQITAEGRKLLASIEAPAVAEQDQAQPIEPTRLPDAMRVPLIGLNRRRQRRPRGRGSVRATRAA